MIVPFEWECMTFKELWVLEKSLTSLTLR
jgi:hypothetical protein